MALDNFENCCTYLGISSELPNCQIREKQLQAVYKLSVCMAAWNKLDGFEPDETAGYYQKDVGYAPHFHHKDGKLLSSGYATIGSSAGIVSALAILATTTSFASLGLRLCLGTRNRAVEFSKTFIDIFNELI